MFAWFGHIFGLDNGSGPWYLFWSGIGSDIGEVVIIGGIIQWYRKASCHVDGCHKIGLHHVEGTGYVTCRKHHPADATSEQDIHAAHHRAFIKPTRTRAKP